MWVNWLEHMDEGWIMSQFNVAPITSINRHVEGGLLGMNDSALVMVVDDDLEVRRLLQLMLNMAGYRVIVAPDGEAALGMLEEWGPDIILLDVRMPKMNGLQVLNMVRQKSDAPVIMVTVNSEADDLQRALDAGADDYVTKPFGTRELLARISAKLRRARMGESMLSEN